MKPKLIVEADYAPLRHALLVTPPDTGIDGEWRDRWWGQFTALRLKLEDLGVTVHVRRPYESRNSIHAVFSRDTFVAQGGRLVSGRMALHRDKEPLDLGVWARAHGYRQETLSTAFEGADLCRHQDWWLCAHGNRTDYHAARMLIESRPIQREKDKMITGWTLEHKLRSIHLLGSLNLVSQHLAVVDEAALFPQEVNALLGGMDVIERPDDTPFDQAANFVTIRPKEILAPDNPYAAPLYADLESEGVKVHLLPVDAYFSAGGGLACAVGVLERSF